MDVEERGGHKNEWTAGLNRERIWSQYGCGGLLGNGLLQIQEDNKNGDHRTELWVTCANGKLVCPCTIRQPAVQKLVYCQ